MTVNSTSFNDHSDCAGMSVHAGWHDGFLTPGRFNQSVKTSTLLNFRQGGCLTLLLSSHHALLAGVHAGHRHAVLQAAAGAAGTHLVAAGGTGAGGHLDASVLLHQVLGGLAHFTA